MSITYRPNMIFTLNQNMEITCNFLRKKIEFQLMTPLQVGYKTYNYEKSHYIRNL